VAAKFLASLPTLGRTDAATDLVEVEEEGSADGDSSNPPDDSVVDQTEGNRNQIAEALKRFRQHT
jgi:hypothetical protein